MKIVHSNKKYIAKKYILQANMSLMFALLAVLLFSVQPIYGVTKQEADDCYKKADYQQAIAKYNELLKQGASASIYYNLGNAYYRSDNIAQAILSYERALRLSPGDEDVRFNLQFATSKTIDKITPVDDNVFSAWYKSVVSLTSVDNWACTGIVCVVLALVLMLTFLFANNGLARRVGFYGSIFFLIVFVVSTLFAWQQKKSFEENEAAVVMKPAVNVKQSPVNNAADAFVIHEGTRVDITDKGIDGWSGIRLGDGREGWVKSKDLEVI